MGVNGHFHTHQMDVNGLIDTRHIICKWSYSHTSGGCQWSHSHTSEGINGYIHTRQIGVNGHIHSHLKGVNCHLHTHWRVVNGHIHNDNKSIYYRVLRQAFREAPYGTI